MLLPPTHAYVIKGVNEQKSQQQQQQQSKAGGRQGKEPSKGAGESTEAHRQAGTKAGKGSSGRDMDLRLGLL